MPLPLFSSPDAFALHGLQILDRALDSVMPMNAAQKRDLPAACRELSALLTSERGALLRPYWTQPRFISAYLRYFLPWNLVRLTSLLPGLELGEIPASPLILDVGSGPLTLPLALWLSRPDLRRRPVTLVVSDTAPHILELGKALFERMREALDPQSPWTARSMRASVTQALRRLYAKPGELWMLSMGNVLNEMEGSRAKPGQQMSARMRALLEEASQWLGAGGRLLAIEPGTRQGGRLMAHLRKSALGGAGEEEDSGDLASMALWEESQAQRDENEEDWEEEAFFQAPLFRPISPCPHAAACPMLARRSTAWCHMNAPASHAPEELLALSARAGLSKDSVSLSFLLLKKLDDGEELPHSSRRRLSARIISEAFPVPNLPGRARYACTERGLALVPQAAHLPSGTLCEGTPSPIRDRRSGAFLLELDHASPPEVRRERRPARQHAPARQGAEGAERSLGEGPAPRRNYDRSRGREGAEKGRRPRRPSREK